MNYQDYIKTELLILIPVLYLIGAGLKKSQLLDRWIPVTLGVISIILCTAWVLSTEYISTLQHLTAALFTSVTQGILIAGASVYVNQLYVQSNKRE